MASGRLFAALVLCASLLGCSQQQLDRTTIAHAIDRKLAAEPISHDCVMIAGVGEINWPMKAEITKATQWPNPILEAMRNAGYLTFDTRSEGLSGLLQGPNVVVITPTEQAKAWYDPQRGFCIGDVAVADVTKWTAPGQASGTPVDASFTWKLTNVPSWAKRPEFATIPGMTTPRDGIAHLIKTNDGWQATTVTLTPAG